MDATELRYRTLAQRFLQLARNTASAHIALMHLHLAAHYGHLAEIRRKYGGTEIPPAPAEAVDEAQPRVASSHTRD